MRKISSVLTPILILVGISVAFFWKFFFKGLIPFPGDLMVGAYLPWLDYKWGNVVGVAIKNPLISDVFSQIYLWKDMVISSFLSGQWPLWNPNSYCGQPLLANFQSGTFNPLNIFMLIFDPKIGWGLLLFGQIVGSTIFMFLFLRSLGFKKNSSLIGAVTYGFSGFSTAWMQFATIGQAMIWIPLLFLCIEKAAKTKNSNYLLFLPILFLFIVGSGHFQALIYAAALTSCYLFYRLKLYTKDGLVFAWAAIFSILLSIGMSAVQLLPTIELMGKSVRFGESYIVNLNFGLLPIWAFPTLVAPDMFGNATTGNYWGFLNYQETVVYAGVLGALSLLYAIYNFKKLGSVKFFFFMAIVSLLMAFDTPIGKAIYVLKIPGLSTSSAGRIGLITVFALAVLTTKMIEDLKNISLFNRLKWPLLATLICGISGVIYVWTNSMFVHDYGANNLSQWIANTRVGYRNLIIPLGIIFLYSAIFTLTKKIKIWEWMILAVVVMDLFRFGWKYLPFVPQQYVYPNSEITDFLKKDKTYFRIDRETGEMMPPNTWSAYGLQSPSGYDPMAVSDYVKQYGRDLNHEINPGVSRYSELQNIDATSLGKYNVKYFLAIKRDELMKLGGNILSYKINSKDWKKVFETKSTAVLENQRLRERARIVDEQGNNASGSATIVSYGNNKVVVEFENYGGTRLLLADTYFPGWQATINGTKVNIENDMKPFRSVFVEKGRRGQVTFEYTPRSFFVGLIVSGASTIIWLVVVLVVVFYKKPSLYST